MEVELQLIKKVHLVAQDLVAQHAAQRVGENGDLALQQLFGVSAAQSKRCI